MLLPYIKNAMTTYEISNFTISSLYYYLNLNLINYRRVKE